MGGARRHLRPGRGAATALALGLLAAAPLSAGSQEPAPTRAEATLTFSETRPGMPTTSTIDIRWRDPHNPAAKPPSVARMVFRFAPGTRFDTTVPLHCKASNAELMARGKEACPAGSRIAAGELLTDNGSPVGVPPRETLNEYTSFSNGDELIGLAESASPPTRVVGRSRLEDGVITGEVPFVPGGPPDNALAFKRLRLSGLPIPGRSGAYLTTPPECPPDGQWRNVLEFTYRDGVTERIVSPTPCTPAAAPAATAAPAPLRLHRVPRRRCVRRSFVVRVVGGASAVTLRLDGRRLRRALRTPARVRVRVARLRPGRHVLTVRAGDESHRRAFRVCRRR
jgi:hypothetical protein